MPQFNPFDESREREARAISNRDAVVRGGPLNDRRQSDSDVRIREHRVAKLTDFFRRRFGRDPNSLEIAEHLGEGGGAA
jgi:hypothetical protein